MQYETYFDIATATDTSWTGIAFGLAFSTASLAILYLRPYLPRSVSSRWMSVVLYLQLGFGIAFALTSYSSVYSPRRQLVNACEGPAATVLEGRVSDVRAIPMKGAGVERFVVGGTEFEYGFGHQGFQFVSADGGPLTDGARVRLRHVNGSICVVELPR